MWAPVSEKRLFSALTWGYESEKGEFKIIPMLNADEFVPSSNIEYNGWPELPRLNVFQNRR